MLLLDAKLNTEASVLGDEIIGGNSTDRAVAELFKKERLKGGTVKEKIPFTSEQKYSSVTLDDGLMLIRGAPEQIISNSKYALGEDGEAYASDLGFVKREYLEATGRGERAIAVGYKREGGELVFVALIILKDKLRAGVREAVASVRRAGVQIIMMTGDSKETATAIASECGIYKIGTGNIALSRDELIEMSDSEVKAILPNIRVISRALPQDKTRLVRLSQEMELVVGMTGDGINDAPSLKLADIGFAMGAGTDIAKAAADIVLLDNSFEAIGKTILYGRTIFKSIRKFITFQLIMNLCACGVSLLGQFIGIENPITIIQMLWINIIMDTLGGLAFAGEAPIGYYMNEKPKRRDEPILSREMLSQIAVTGGFTLLLSILFFRLELFREIFGYYRGDNYYLTAFYALFIFSGIFNCFGARCERLWIFSNIGKNKPFIFIMILISAIQIIMIYSGGALFRSMPLEPADLLGVVFLAFLVIPFEILRRIFHKLGAG